MILGVIEDTRDWLFDHQVWIGIAGGLATLAVVALAFLGRIASFALRVRLRRRPRRPHLPMLDAFVGREVDIKRFEQLISDKRRNRRFLISISGKPGMGKSWLTARFIESCRHRGVLSATIDFAEPAVSRHNLLEVLMRFAYQLGTGEFSTFVRQHVEFQQTIDARKMYHREVTVAEVDETSRRIAGAFWNDLELAIGSRRCCFFLDHFELIHETDLERSLRDSWISRCPSSLIDRVTFVIASWNALDWENLATKTLHVVLSAFSSDEIRERVRMVPHLRSKAAYDIAATIESATQGWPTTVGLACSILGEMPRDEITIQNVAAVFDEAGPLNQELRLRFMADHLLTRLTPESMRTLRSMACARWFTGGQLATAFGAADGLPDLFANAVDRFAAILRPRQESGYEVDPEIRSIILDQWQSEAPESLRDCHQRLETYYETLAARAQRNYRLEALVEALYHTVELYRVSGARKSRLTAIFRDVFLAGEQLGSLETMDAAVREISALQDDAEIDSWAHVFGARALLWKGRWDEAFVQLSEARSNRPLSQELAGFTGQFLALLAYDKGNISLARECFSQAEENLAALPLNHARFVTEVGGTILRADGRADEAAVAYDDAADLLVRHEDLYSAGYALLRLADLHRLTGKLSLAAAVSARALPICEETENPVLRGRILYILGRTQMQQGRWETAHTTLSEALKLLAVEHSPPLEVAVAQRNQAEVLQFLGEIHASRSMFVSSLGLFLEIGAGIDTVYLYNCLSRFFHAEGETDAANEVCRLSLSLIGESGDRHARGTAALALSELQVGLGRYEEIHRLLKSGLDTFRSLGLNHLRARALVCLFVSEKTLATPGWPARSRELASVLRAARANGDQYHDIVASLGLFLAIASVHDAAAYDHPVPAIAARQLAGSMRHAAAFHPLLSRWHLLKFADSLRHTGRQGRLLLEVQALLGAELTRRQADASFSNAVREALRCIIDADMAPDSITRLELIEHLLPR